MSSETSALAVTCKCGSAVYLAVHIGPGCIDMEEVSHLIARGYDAKWLPLNEAKALEFGCRCGKEKAA